jgi:hypothetical protein
LNQANSPQDESAVPDLRHKYSSIINNAVAAAGRLNPGRKENLKLAAPFPLVPSEQSHPQQKF